MESKELNVSLISAKLFQSEVFWHFLLSTVTDKWTSKGYFTQTLQQGMIAFTIDNYAYVVPGG